MAPATPTPLSTDATNPSVARIHIRTPWAGAKLDRTTGDFNQWAEHFTDALIMNGLDEYVLDPVIPRPPADTEPRAHVNWVRNNRLAITYIRTALADTETTDLVVDKGANECFKDLKARAQREGPVKQVSLLREALATYCSLSEPLPTTAKKISDIVRRAYDVGEINCDLFTCIALLNSLNDHAFESLQASVSQCLANSTKAAPFTSADIRRLMENQQTIINSKSHHSSDVALTANAGKQQNRGFLPGHNHGEGGICWRRHGREDD
ncbi:hypothetical protein D9615_001950 [Tricholomella constricta]|uniref:Uncharacterized protein n=1 Tax=Tricholomella constricta TaxID=117010 RepID=A0A8H5HP91_9AGAR|nr:hypothetical protein D9615_001950 [Tricholomella constricta]